MDRLLAGGRGPDGGGVYRRPRRRDRGLVAGTPGGTRRAHRRSVRASAPVTFRDETIENKPRPDVTRLAFSFAQPVTNATLTIVYAPSHFPRPSAATSVDDYFRCVIVRKG